LQRIVASDIRLDKEAGDGRSVIDPWHKERLKGNE
jgi:hypothetical protein